MRDNHVEKYMVKWQNSYSVGISQVDEQHKELINLTNKLFISCMDSLGSSGSTFLEVLHKVVDYVGYHFGTEEKIMKRVNYPGFLNHKREHEAFVREVFTKAEEFETKKIQTPLLFVYFLKDWVLKHIAVCDKQMGEYLKLLMKNGELHRMALQERKDEEADILHSI